MDSRIQFALMLDWVHVGRNMYKGGRVLYNVRSAHPSTTKKKKQNKTKQQQKHNNNKNTHTHTHKHLLWYGAERAAVSRSCHGAPRPENGDTNS